MPFDAILIGDVSIDEFLQVDDAQVVCDINHSNCKICFDYAQKIPVAKFKTSLGGNSANVALGMARLGLNVSVYSQIGNDSNGARFMRELKERGVDNSLLVQNNHETDIHSIIIYKGERTIFSYHHPKQYKLQNWEEPKWIYYTSLPQNFEVFQQELIDYVKNHPKVLTAFNPGVYHFKAGYLAYKPFLEITDVLFVNKEEAIKILSQAQDTRSNVYSPDYKNNPTPDSNKNFDLIQIHKSLQALGPKVVVITNAEQGASVSSENDFYQSCVYEIDKPIVDKTGAGDAFASGFLSALIYGKDLKTALTWGLKNSSACIREIGPMNGLLSLEEI